MGHRNTVSKARDHRKALGRQRERSRVRARLEVLKFLPDQPAHKSTMKIVDQWLAGLADFGKR
jgi:hypothetical protein